MLPLNRDDIPFYMCMFALVTFIPLIIYFCFWVWEPMTQAACASQGMKAVSVGRGEACADDRGALYVIPWQHENAPSGMLGKRGSTVNH